MEKDKFTMFEKTLNNELWRVIACEALFKIDEVKYTKDLAQLLVGILEEQKKGTNNK